MIFNSAKRRRKANEQRRQLHAKIARSRRRINGNTSRLVRGGFLPSGWRKQIQDHPVIALASAAGAGMLLAQICGHGGVASKSADWLAETLAGGKLASMIKHVESLFSSGSFAEGEASDAPEQESEPTDA